MASWGYGGRREQQESVQWLEVHHGIKSPQDAARKLKDRKQPPPPDVRTHIVGGYGRHNLVIEALGSTTKTAN